MKYKKPLLLALILLLLVPLETFAALPGIARQQLDPELKITSGYQWNNSDSYPTLFYEIRGHPDRAMNRNDYMYEMNWHASVDGQRVNKNVILLRPRGAGNLSRTFIQPSDASWWAQQLSGNENYVKTMSLAEPTIIRNNFDGKTSQRIYTKDMGEWTGAIVDYERTGEYDGPVPNGNGHYMGVVTFQTTPLPTATLDVPSSVNGGQPITVNFSAQEHYPHHEYDTTPFIKYELKLDGEVIKTGSDYASSVNDSYHLSTGICKAGSHTIELTATDLVERSNTVKKTVSVKGDGEECKPPKEEPGSSDGEARGRAFWELQRTDESKESQVYLENSFVATGSHYAMRNPEHQVNIADYNIRQRSPVTLQTTGREVKGQSLNYSFQYEYTNYRMCIAWSEEGGCTAYGPDWSRGKTFRISGALPMDHSQGDTFKEDTVEEILSQQWVVGREDKWNPRKESKTYHEQWRKAEDNDRKSYYDLKTQTTLPITPGKWIYEVELPSGLHEKKEFYPMRKDGGYGFYYPVDVDDSLKNEYGK